MAARRVVKRYEFENCTQGFLGAIKINRKGDDESIAVAPGERVFLTREEIELSEQSHARSEDSPFVVKEIVHFDPATGDEIKRFASAPLRKVERPSAAPVEEPVAA